MNFLITIIVPVYNANKYISETIESIIGQTYNTWELIIVDDCSTDDTVSIIKKYVKLDKRIFLVESEQNFGGPARPRNIGIKKAKGEYIAFLDADDIWKKDKLQRQMDFMSENNVYFSSTGSEYIDENSNSIKKRLSIFSFLHQFRRKTTINDIINSNFITTSSVVVHREYIELFSEKKEHIAVEDVYLWLSILNKNPNIYKYQKEKLVRYRVLDNSISNRKNSIKHQVKGYSCILDFIRDSGRYDCIKAYHLHVLKMAIRIILKRV